MQMQRKAKEGESYLAFVKRATHALEDGLIDIDTWGEAVLGNNIYNEENTRRCSKFFIQFVNRLDEEVVGEAEEEEAKVLRQLKEELKAERIKIQTANIEYNANARADARAEMFWEQIIEAIDRLEPLCYNQVKFAERDCNSTGVLCIADAHYGTEIDMPSLFGEVVNVYNPDILKARLSRLLEMVSDNYETFGYDKLIVFDLGDAIQGILRMSDLSKLRTGVIDSAIEYAEMIATWLNDLAAILKVSVEYFCLGGNHCELRLLDKGKNWEEENMGKIIREFVYLRLKDNPNIKVHDYSEFGFVTLYGTNILAIHGDGAKDDMAEISYWENYHQINIDILLMGHVHHSEQNTVGYGLTGDKEIIKVPSLIGVDSFSKKCRKIARAGAKFMLFDENGKSWERTYFLN